MAQVKFKGMHPRFGYLKSQSNIPPNMYHPEKLKRFQNINFKRKEEVEEFSRNLGFKVPQILKEKINRVKNLGPAWHDVCDFEFIPLIAGSDCLKGKDNGFSLAERFVHKPTKTPGPGTYIKKHTDFNIHQWTPVKSFEWNQTQRGQKDALKWSLAPNRYMYDRDYNSIYENLKKRKVSKRGPYDLFTGPRDETTIKNYFGPPLPREAKSWPYQLVSSIDALLQDKYKGTWSDCPRNILLDTKDTHSVSPCHYDPILTSDYKPQNRLECKFNIHEEPARPEVKYKVHPAPGRYTVKKIECGKCCTSSFRYKGDRFRYVVKKTDHLC